MSTLLSHRYQLLDRLGSGGMGAVYRAHDILTGEEVALKRVISTAVTPPTPELKLALAHEFQALAALRHPHVIAARDYGFDQASQPFFTMELLPTAVPLTQAGQWQDVTGKVALLAQLLQALIYVHRHHIIHRDLKPGNVLVADGAVKLLDFGLAALAGHVGETSGTLLYMAPELLRGAPVTAVSDLYAVGVLAYELLAGWHPFDPTSLDFIKNMLTQEPDFSYVDAPPELVAVVRRLLAKEPDGRYPDAAAALEAWCTAVAMPLPAETAVTRDSFLQAAPFTGRQSELDQLLAALKQAAHGKGSAILIGGESGVGKSRLLNELRTRALVAGTAVLRGSARADGSPFHLWQELLPTLLLLAPPDEMETAVLAPLLPDITRFTPTAPRPLPPLEPDKARTRLLLTITGLLYRAAQKQPLLLLLEELHWADDASLELLQWLLRDLHKQPCLILAAYRLGERPSLPTDLPTMSHLRLPRLPAAAIAELSQAMLGPHGRQPALLTFLEQQTEGNTFFIVEVMRALAEEAGRLDHIPQAELPAHIFPQGIQDVVRRRLNRVGKQRQPLLRLAAIAGRQLDLTLLSPFIAGDLLPATNEMEEWLTACTNALILERPDGSPHWQFSHDKLREALLADLAPAEKEAMHRQIGLGIETVYAAHLAPYYGDLAAHFRQAGMADKEIVYLQLAAAQAQAAYANETALAYYGRLLTLLTDSTARIEAGLASGAILKLTGRWDEAESQLAMAADLSRQTADPLLQARCLQAAGNLARSRSDYPAALRWLAEAQNLLTAGHVSGIEEVNAEAQRRGDLTENPSRLSRPSRIISLLVDVLVEIGNVYQQQGAYEAARPYLQLALEEAEAANDRAAMALAWHNLGSNHYMQGQYRPAQTYYEKALAVRRELDDKLGCASTYNNLGNIAFRLGDYALAQQQYAASLELRQQMGDVWGTAAALNNLGIVPYHRQDYETARRYWEEALAVRRALGDEWTISQTVDNLALIARVQGRYAEALQLSDEGIHRRRQLDDKQGLAIALGNRARLLADMNDLPAAEALYQESLSLSQEIDDRRGVVYCLIGLADVYRRQGAADGARPYQLILLAQRLLAEMEAHMEEDEQELAGLVLAQAERELDTAVLVAARAEVEMMTEVELMQKM